MQMGSPVPRVAWSEFCEGNDNVSLTDGGGGAVFVVPDSDDEETLADGRVCGTKTKWRPVVKRDPYPVKENLHLGYEEVSRKAAPRVPTAGWLHPGFPQVLES